MIKTLKAVGALLGIVLILLDIFTNAGTEVWIVGMLLCWGYIYSLKD